MKRTVLSLMALVIMVGSSAMPAMAQSRYYRNNYQNYYQNNTSKQYVQKALIGGGVGAALGSLLANDGFRADGAVKGGLIGAGVGLGYEYLKQNNNNRRYW